MILDVGFDSLKTGAGPFAVLYVVRHIDMYLYLPIFIFVLL